MKGGPEEKVVPDSWHSLWYYMPSNQTSIWAQAWRMCGDAADVEIETAQRSHFDAIDLSASASPGTSKSLAKVMTTQR